jgi:hypothetical protein
MTGALVLLLAKLLVTLHQYVGASYVKSVCSMARSSFGPLSKSQLVLLLTVLCRFLYQYAPE